MGPQHPLLWTGVLHIASHACRPLLAQGPSEGDRPLQSGLSGSLLINTAIVLYAAGQAKALGKLLGSLWAQRIGLQMDCTYNPGVTVEDAGLQSAVVLGGQPLHARQVPSHACGGRIRHNSGVSRSTAYMASGVPRSGRKGRCAGVISNLYINTRCFVD